MVNTSYIQNSLYTKIQASGWGSLLKGFLFGQEFEKIISQLEKEVDSGIRFTPTLKYLFRCFEECNYNELKVVFLCQDPYKHINVADGLAMSCKNNEYPQPTLKYFYKAIKQTVYDADPYYKFDMDLKHIANQGVLFLNAALTTQIDKTGAHIDLWLPFTKYVIEQISQKENGVIFVLLGKQAQTYQHLIDPEKHTLYNVTHPANAAYLKLENWDCKDVFNKINKELKDKYNQKIIW